MLKKLFYIFRITFVYLLIFHLFFSNVSFVASIALLEIILNLFILIFFKKYQLLNQPFYYEKLKKKYSEKTIMFVEKAFIIYCLLLSIVSLFPIKSSSYLSVGVFSIITVLCVCYALVLYEVDVKDLLRRGFDLDKKNIIVGITMIVVLCFGIFLTFKGNEIYASTQKFVIPFLVTSFISIITVLLSR